MATAGYTLSDLQNLQSDAAYYQQDAQFSNLRIKAVQEAGQELGMQTALASESRVIDQILLVHAEQLNQVFNFRLLMYKDNVLPPVIVTADNLLRISHTGDALHIGGKTYRIISQVRFVTAPPTWRDYLWMDYPYPQYPNPMLLPKTDAERAAWNQAVAIGWKLGIAQALTIYDINLNRLTRDFNGMVLYRQLLAENMVSPFYVAKQDYGVTGNGNHITIDDQNWQITIKPELQIHSELWQPVLISQPAENGAEGAP